MEEKSTIIQMAIDIIATDVDLRELSKDCCDNLWITLRVLSEIQNVLDKIVK